jgi:hypothetical protein
MSKVGQHSPEIGDRLWKVMATRYHVHDFRPPDLIEVVCGVQ